MTRIFSFEPDGTLLQSEGGYEEYRQRRKKAEETAGAEGASGLREQSGGGNASGGKGKKPRTERPKTRLSYKEQREQEALLKEQEELPARLEALEQEQAKLEAELADPDLFSRDPDGFNAKIARIPQIEEEQLALLERSEEIEERLKELEI